MASRPPAGGRSLAASRRQGTVSSCSSVGSGTVLSNGAGTELYEASDLSLCLGLYEALWHGKARVRVPDTLVFRKGHVVSWWFTSYSKGAGEGGCAQAGNPRADDLADISDRGRRQADDASGKPAAAAADKEQANFRSRASSKGTEALDGNVTSILDPRASAGPDGADADEDGTSVSKQLSLLTLARRRSSGRKQETVAVAARADSPPPQPTVPLEMAAVVAATTAEMGEAARAPAAAKRAAAAAAGGRLAEPKRRAPAAARWADCRLMRKKPATLRALSREDILKLFAQRQPSHSHAGAGAMPPLTTATAVAALWATDHGAEQRVVTRALCEAELPDFLDAILHGELDGLLQRPPPGGRMPACVHVSFTRHHQPVTLYRATRTALAEGGAGAAASARRLPSWMSEPSEVVVQTRLSPALEASLRCHGVESVVSIVQKYLDTVAVGVRLWALNLCLLMRDDAPRPLPGARGLDEWAGAQLWLGWGSDLRLSSLRTSEPVPDQWVAPLHRARQPPSNQESTSLKHSLRGQQMTAKSVADQAERRLWLWPLRAAIPFAVPFPPPVRPLNKDLISAAAASGATAEQIAAAVRTAAGKKAPPAPLVVESARGSSAASSAVSLEVVELFAERLNARRGSRPGHAEQPPALIEEEETDESAAYDDTPGDSFRRRRRGTHAPSAGGGSFKCAAAAEPAAALPASMSGSVFHMPTAQMRSYAHPPWWEGWRPSRPDLDKPPSPRGSPSPRVAPRPPPAPPAGPPYADSASFARAARRYGTRLAEDDAPSRAVASERPATHRPAASNGSALDQTLDASHHGAPAAPRPPPRAATARSARAPLIGR